MQRWESQLLLLERWMMISTRESWVGVSSSSRLMALIKQTRAVILLFRLSHFQNSKCLCQSPDLHPNEKHVLKWFPNHISPRFSTCHYRGMHQQTWSYKFSHKWLYILFILGNMIWKHSALCKYFCIKLKSQSSSTFWRSFIVMCWKTLFSRF